MLQRQQYSLTQVSSGTLLAPTSCTRTRVHVQRERERERENAGMRPTQHFTDEPLCMCVWLSGVNDECVEGGCSHTTIAGRRGGHTLKQS